MIRAASSSVASTIRHGSGGRMLPLRRPAALASTSQATRMCGLGSEGHVFVGRLADTAHRNRDDDEARDLRRYNVSTAALHHHLTLHPALHNSSLLQRRFMTTCSSADGPVAPTAEQQQQTKPNFEETMDQLFQTSQQQVAPSSESDQWFLDQAAAVEPWDPKWWNLADQAINAVKLLHDTTGIEYAGCIVAATCILRLCIFPLAVSGQRNASRMAHVQPELEQMKKRYEAIGTPTRAEQVAFGEQVQALFKRFEVNPWASMAAPLVQAPAFIGMFFGMKKMPELFPQELSTGGILWFTDLTAADPLYVMPVVCGLTFIATVELGKDQMIDANPSHGPTIVNAFRAMAVVMVPAIMYFPAAMLCYWVPNNLITMGQSVVLRNAWVKKEFGIWDRPKPVPGATPDVGFQETMTKLVKQVKGEPTTDKERIQKHNQEIETKRKVQQVSKDARFRRRG